MLINEFYILSDSNQFSIDANTTALPVVYIEKQRVFQIIDSRPFYKNICCELINCGCRINSFVWISHKRKAIYFENPKAGSSSIKVALGLPEPDLITCLIRIFSEYFALDKYAIRIIDYSNTLTDQDVKDTVLKVNDMVINKTLYMGKHPIVTNYSPGVDFELYFGDRTLLNKLFNDYFAFSIVRHPADRFSSNYLMFTQKNYRVTQMELLCRRSYQNLKLSDFIHITQNFDNHHWNKQSLFIPESIEDFDRHFIGKLENFKEDWKLISEQLGIDFIHTHVNKTEHQEISLTDNGQDIEKIKDLYKDDLRRFNYQ